MGAALTALGDIPVTAVFSRTTTGAFNPVTGTYATATLATHSCTGVLADYKQGLIDGTLIQTGDLELTFRQAALGITPTTNDKVTADGTSYSIINIAQDPAGATWVLQLRS